MKSSQEMQREHKELLANVAGGMAEEAQGAWDRGENEVSIAASLIALNANLERLMATVSDVGFFIGDRS